jgi:hypothetical protein
MGGSECSELFDEAMGLNNNTMDLKETGSNFLRVFDGSGDRINLDLAISALEEAEHNLSWGHATRATVATNLAISFHERFKLAGNATDLDRAIQLQSEALDVQRASRGCHRRRRGDFRLHRP